MVRLCNSAKETMAGYCLTVRWCNGQSKPEMNDRQAITSKNDFSHDMLIMLLMDLRNRFSEVRA